MRSNNFGSEPKAKQVFCGKCERGWIDSKVCDCNTVGIAAIQDYRRYLLQQDWFLRSSEFSKWVEDAGGSRERAILGNFSPVA